MFAVRRRPHPGFSPWRGEPRSILICARLLPSPQSWALLCANGRQLGVRVVGPPPRRSAAARPVAVQRRTLRSLVHKARRTRFGRDHGFGAIRTVADFQRAVPLRTYEDLWDAVSPRPLPGLRQPDLAGPHPLPGADQRHDAGGDEVHPRLARDARLEPEGGADDGGLPPGQPRPTRGSSTAGSSSWAARATWSAPPPASARGTSAGSRPRSSASWLRPYTFPPLELALEPDWDRKLARLAERSLKRADHAGRRRAELAARPLSAPARAERQVDDRRGLAARSRSSSTAASSSTPTASAFAQILGSPTVRLQETYPCSEGFIAFGDPATGLLRLVFDHGIFYEFVPVDELGSERPTRHWLGDVRTGVNYAIVVSTCAGMWAHVIGDTVRFESLDPPLLTLHRADQVHALGLRRAPDQRGGRGGDRRRVGGHRGLGPRLARRPGLRRSARASPATSSSSSSRPATCAPFREALDADLCRRNADYQAHRAEGVGLPLPALVVARPGGFDAWMRSRGKLGGQNKVPRMDNDGDAHPPARRLPARDGSGGIRR